MKAKEPITRTGALMGTIPSAPAPEFITKINWALLRRQKRALLNLSSKLNRTEQTDIQGIINMIDVIQDYAVDNMGISERIVFGLKYE